jgi:hypothetical protein
MNIKFYIQYSDWAMDWSSILVRGKSVQTSSGAHPDCCTTGTGGCCPGGKAAVATKLHGVTTKETVIFIVTNVGSSNLAPTTYHFTKETTGNMVFCIKYSIRNSSPVG